MHRDEGASGRCLEQLFQKPGVADQIKNTIGQPPSGARIGDLPAPSCVPGPHATRRLRSAGPAWTRCSLPTGPVAVPIGTSRGPALTP
jgi:hypothetical protein